MLPINKMDLWDLPVSKWNLYKFNFLCFIIKLFGLSIIFVTTCNDLRVVLSGLKTLIGEHCEKNLAAIFAPPLGVEPTRLRFLRNVGPSKLRSSCWQIVKPRCNFAFFTKLTRACYIRIYYQSVYRNPSIFKGWY